MSAAELLLKRLVEQAGGGAERLARSRRGSSNSRSINVDRLTEEMRRRTLPTVVDRRLLTELLIDACVGEQVRSRAPAEFLAGWAREPPRWGDDVRRLVQEAPPSLHGDEGRLLAWALAARRADHRRASRGAGTAHPASAGPAAARPQPARPLGAGDGRARRAGGGRGSRSGNER